MSTDMFRAEAVAHHVNGTEEGDILRYDNTWTRLSYALLVVACLSAFAFLSLFTIDEWATGRCVVRIEGREVITATVPGTVISIEVKPGALVEEGAMLVKMSAAEETAELERAIKDFDLALVRMLRDPNDAETKVTLGSLRARRDQAKNALDARVIKARVAGFVTDIRTRPGQLVKPGEIIVSLSPKSATQASILAMVPADYRPLLELGQKMRFELDGFRYEYADLKVEEVSAEAIGPTEVARFLGDEKVGTVASSAELGAKVLVSAKLAKATFTSEGQPFEYFDGLTGTAEIRVRRETLLVMLIPALRAFMK